MAKGTTIRDVAAAPAAAQPAAICYNCPPEWADWASQLKAIKSTTRTPASRCRR